MDGRTLMAEVAAARREKGWSIMKASESMGIAISTYVAAQRGENIGVRVLAAIRRTFPQLKSSVDRFLVDYQAQK